MKNAEVFSTPLHFYTDQMYVIGCIGWQIVTLKFDKCKNMSQYMENTAIILVDKPVQNVNNQMNIVTDLPHSEGNRFDMPGYFPQRSQAAAVGFQRAPRPCGV